MWRKKETILKVLKTRTEHVCFDKYICSQLFAFYLAEAFVIDDDFAVNLSRNCEIWQLIKEELVL